MVWMPGPADAETIARRSALAQAVQEDLAAAGLPITTGSTGFETALAAGAHVFFDHLDDQSGGGVFVEWNVHHVLRSAALTAVTEGRSDHPTVVHSGAAARAMQDAIAEILTATGCTIRKNYSDLEPFQLRVIARNPQPSWRDWIDDQTDARAAAMRATYARRAKT
jgi:hypothetical protein